MGGDITPSKSEHSINKDIHNLLGDDRQKFTSDFMKFLIDNGWNQSKRLQSPVNVNNLKILIWEGRNSQASRLEREFLDKPLPRFLENVEKLRKSFETTEAPGDWIQELFTTLTNQKKASRAEKYKSFLESIGLNNVPYPPHGTRGVARLHPELA